ncbi:hypothetical protein ASE86_01610 [Sphingomonas sp. Leaf33]|uniref:hypothetical protein n=1 Tax=Sphingomonas sp. Leaf33 TaxID=1736215 RepID=UPI0006FD0FD1|nr:hypothetical protein [Sphingomonas sp. Leaf33]KQN24998.1 hypothetical protein ASE86_01610 [Sphingomonas sp. Leaf33]
MTVIGVALALLVAQAGDDASRKVILDDFVASIPPPMNTPRPVSDADIARLSADGIAEQKVRAILATYEQCRFESGSIANRSWLRRVAATMPEASVRRLTAFYTSDAYRRMRTIMLQPPGQTTKAERAEVIRMGEENGADAFLAASRKVPNTERQAAETLCKKARDEHLGEAAR